MNMKVSGKMINGMESLFTNSKMETFIKVGFIMDKKTARENSQHYMAPFMKVSGKMIN